MKKMRRDNGFTMLELVVTICIIAILTTIAVTSYIHWLPRYRMRSAATDILSSMQFARLKALKENARVVMAFTEGTGEKGRYIAFFDSNKNNVYNSGENIVRAGEMPGGTKLDHNFSFGKSYVAFNGRGLANWGGNVKILGPYSSSIATEIKIVINRTGNSRIE